MKEIVFCCLFLFLTSAMLCAQQALPQQGRTGLQLPLFPKSTSPAQTQYHVDLLEASHDVRFALTVLQGLVSREQPRFYITQDPGWHGPSGIPKWIEDLKQRGYVFEDVEDPLSLFEQFRDSFQGVVLYEDNLAEEPLHLHKLNVLTLYCALNNLVPVTEELNTQLDLPVYMDSRGRFNDPEEAYRWAYEELWPQANREALAFLAPQHVVLRDYLVAHRILPVWNSVGMSPKAEEICYWFFDEIEANSPVLGCWAGYGEQPAGRVNEANLQRIASQRGKWVLVSDGNFNLTFHSGLEFQKPDLPPRQPREIVFDPEKIYITFTVTDGDNIQYVQQYFRSPQWWEDPRRGEIPIGWSMNPIAYELVPDVLEYFLKTATPNDEFFTSTAGIGLVAPALYGKDLYSNYQAVYNDYIRLTAEAMAVTGFDMIHLGDTSNIPWTRADFQDWADRIPGLKGVLGDYARSVGISYNNTTFKSEGGVPIIRSLVAPGHRGITEESPQDYANAIRYMVPQERPAFIHACLVNWFMSPGVLAEALDILGDEFVPVLPSEMFRLVLEHQLTD